MTRVRTGLDSLLSGKSLSLLRGRRVGLLANPTSLDPDLQHTADLLVAAGVELTALFGPEHGVRGDAQDMVGIETTRDARLGLPVHSLYGASPETLTPSPECLSGIDLLCIDLQDIGSRYYTYVWTMTLALEACARAGVSALVLDRPNPLGGGAIEGPGIARGFESFVGLHDVAVRHGLTIGELARLVVSERGIGLELTVVELEGWRREQCYDETGLPWVLPSPNMPTLETAFVYPGGCLLEGTNLSEGRGTTRPFEIVGAPWIDGAELCAALAAEDLPGVRFRPLAFRPCFHKHAGEVCGGLQLHVLDRSRYRSLRTGVALLQAAFRLWPAQTAWRREVYEFVRDRPAIDLLAGGDWLRVGIDAGASLEELARGWESDERRWRERCRPWMLY